MGTEKLFERLDHDELFSDLSKLKSVAQALGFSDAAVFLGRSLRELRDLDDSAR